MGEPPRSQGDLHFSLFGIPVRVHPMFWLIGVLLTARSLLDTTDVRQALGILLPWMVALFISILVHELGHAMAMRAYGFSPQITLHGLGGLTSYDPSVSYGAKGSDTLGQVLISLAGPGAGFLLAALLVAVIKLSGHHVGFLLGAKFGLAITVEQVGSALFTDLIWYMLYISIFWGLINLLPVYPLDGGQIAREVLLRFNPHDGIRQSLYLSVLTGTALAVLALVQWRDLFVAFLFGYLAYASYATLQSYRGRGPW